MTIARCFGQFSLINVWPNPAPTVGHGALMAHVPDLARRFCSWSHDGSHAPPFRRSNERGQT